MSDVVIKVEDLGKLYRLGEIGTGTLSHDLNRWWARMRGKPDPFAKIGQLNDRTQKGEGDYVWALKDVNFEVRQGEVLGIIGRNGAGKSTLLKILSKVTTPTRGHIKLKGRIASLLEVGTGFHQELTGRENIFLNGAILGMTRAEVRKKFDEIVDFAGVERYIDTPVKRYSSGMYVRLAFAVAAFLESEILIIDEVLAVGDAEFQQKCLGRMKSVSRTDHRTILFVSHDLNAVSQLCDRALLFQSGELLKLGNVDNVLSDYINNGKKLSVYHRSFQCVKANYIRQIKICDSFQNQKTVFLHTENIYIETECVTESGIGAGLFIIIVDSKKRPVFSCECDLVADKMILEIAPNQLVRGSYTVTVFINMPNIARLDEVNDVCYFEIIDNGSKMSKHGTFDYGSVFGNYKWI